jgi:hypothetical protein
MRLPGLIVILLTRARIRIVKRRIDRQPLQAVPLAPRCGLDCPGAEEMAEYIERRLPGFRQAEIDEHLSTCPSCFEVYEGVLRFQLEQERE